MRNAVLLPLTEEVHELGTGWGVFKKVKPWGIASKISAEVESGVNVSENVNIASVAWKVSELWQLQSFSRFPFDLIFKVKWWQWRKILAFTDSCSLGLLSCQKKSPVFRLNLWHTTFGLIITCSLLGKRRKIFTSYNCSFTGNHLMSLVPWKSHFGRYGTVEKCELHQSKTINQLKNISKLKLLCLKAVFMPSPTVCNKLWQSLSSIQLRPHPCKKANLGVTAPNRKCQVLPAGLSHVQMKNVMVAINATYEQFLTRLSTVHNEFSRTLALYKFM
jgi:hypothetical protein